MIASKFSPSLARILRPLEAEDRVPAAVGGLLSLVVYVYTLAPGVTFKDSGELIVAALHFGVPHPTGYPLWTFLAGLFSLLPIGSGAWEVNLFSAVCAALSAAIVAGLMSHMARRLRASRVVGAVVSLSVSLVFAFSVSVWSQAVFAEVYTLHILVAALFWWALYRWYLEPFRRRGFLLCVFFLALGMSNHHLMLALAPVPFLVAWLVRRDMVWELVGYSAATGAVVYLAFASIADNSLPWETATRTGQLALIALVVLVLLRRRLEHWRFGLLILPTVALGLLPYAYMPLASATNPPMNWGYTQTADGFYYSVNRSPYRGPLSEQLMGTLGRLVGTADLEAAQVDLPGASGNTAAESERPSALGLLAGFSKRYVIETSRSFTWLAWPLIAFAAWRLRAVVQQRSWVLVLGAGFGLSFLFQPASAAFAGAAARLEWFLQMPYLGYSYLPLAWLLGFGLVTAHGWLVKRSGLAASLLVGVAALLPLSGLTSNADECSQRGRWFAWQYGHDMLAELPEGAVVFGGGDAGRFIPTYMIFGESLEKPGLRRDPDFDRRDVAIITQTQLLVRYYRQYIRDHYGAERPEPGRLGRLLRRHESYPENPLVLPTEDDVALLIAGLNQRGGSIDSLGHEIARWIYEANRDEHEFYVEDSRMMPWTEPLAVPAGPLYRLAEGPGLELSDEEIDADHAYWRQTVDRLVADPLFEHDLDARMAFSSLRHTSAKIYRQRGLWADAEQAFRESLEMLPNELATVLSLGDLMARQGRYREAREAIAQYRDAAEVMTRVDGRWAERQSLIERRSALHTQLYLTPRNTQVVGEVLRLHRDEETAGGRVMNLADDLKALQEDPANAVAFRRALTSYRVYQVDSLADHFSRRQLEEAPSRRLLQLLVADQLLQPPRLDEAGRRLRLALADRLVEVGEAELAL
ncbi:MAG: DUF2723 domain-containing protein, partial [Acidobacteriota bacterium]